jgi:hypothetical protein
MSESDTEGTLMMEVTDAFRASDYWKGIKRLSKLCRRHRRLAAARKLPIIKDFCRRYDIEMLLTDHGYQFRKNEYIVNWSPSTNRVQIQYALPGHNKTVAFEGTGQYNKPKILVALEEVIEMGSFLPQFA